MNTLPNRNCKKVTRLNKISSSQKRRKISSSCHSSRCGCKNQQQTCQCSGRLNFQAGDVIANANICPNCNPYGSSLSFTGFGDFNPTFIGPPQCMSTTEGTILVVTGFGTIIDGSSTYQGTFSLTLFELPGNSDAFSFTFSGIDQNGNLMAALILSIAPDEDISIDFCSFDPQVPFVPSNISSQLQQIRDGLNNGRIVIIRNGDVEVKEF